MRRLLNLTDDLYQNHNLIAGGNNVSFTLTYSLSQREWYYSLEGGDFALHQQRLVVSPNILHRYRNKVSFGLMVTSTDNGDPLLSNDFKEGRIAIYLLSASESRLSEQYFAGSLPKKE
ncbi:MAG: hypothetical protein FWE37_06240 [Spirochaetaceae bacterium]|nr:hypothetical protein [Spirochaetaceae bacterium]